MGDAPRRALCHPSSFPRPTAHPGAANRTRRCGAITHRRRGLLPNCVLCVPVFAYLDPGTGSMLVQLVVGGLAAIAVTAKFYWRRLLTFLKIRKPAPEPEQET
jgi:hypothetical protein